MEKAIFERLASLVDRRVGYMNYLNFKPNTDNVKYGEAVSKLCAYGLIEIETIKGSGNFIKKTNEFYIAEMIGYNHWIAQRKRKIDNQKAIDNWDKVYYKYRSQATRYWWVSIPISLIAMAISLFQAFS